MRLILSVIFCITLSLIGRDAFPQDNFKLYPVKNIYLSDNAQKNDLFVKALSDGSGNNRIFAIDTFLTKFKKTFSNYVPDVSDQNKYYTFVAYINIPRVSQYKIQKTETLIDLSLPLTMSINFANVITGELIYSYAYTYYSQYNTTINSYSEKETIKLYRDTYAVLLDRLLEEAKRNFRPYLINARVKKTWKGYHILDKGKNHGITEDDELIDQYGKTSKVRWATLNYSVAESLLGDVKSDSNFFKSTNDPIDTIKKPRVMPLSVQLGDIKSVPEEVVYQLFSAALGKKATFSVTSTSRDKSFITMRKDVTRLTTLTREIREKRGLPDYFLRLYFQGPFSANIASNKNYVSYDVYNMTACADIVNDNGRILYTKCVDEKISDEVFENSRFTKIEREEVIVKNSITKLANDFIENVKIKDLELQILKADKNQVVIDDKYNVLTPDGKPLRVFTSLGKIDGVDGNVYVPISEVNVLMKEGKNTVADINFKKAEPAKGDMIFLRNIETKCMDNSKVIKVCGGARDLGGDYNLDKFKNYFLCAISEGITYPFCSTEEFKKEAENFNKVDDGSFQGIVINEPKTDYCIEPVYKITRKGITNSKNEYDTHKFNIIAGIKIYKNKAVVWKNGLQQDVSIAAPKNYQKQVLDSELSKYVYNLLNDMVKKIDLKNN